MMRGSIDTVLDHLPLVTGSEKDMNVHVIQKNGFDSSVSCDEFGQKTNNLHDIYGDRTYHGGWLRLQSEYIVVVEGQFRDREFEQTLKEFNNWICRLAKRIMIEYLLVKVEGCGNENIMTNRNEAYSDMYEYPSWSNDGVKNNTKNWCEYLMWEDK